VDFKSVGILTRPRHAPIVLVKTTILACATLIMVPSLTCRQLQSAVLMAPGLQSASIFLARILTLLHPSRRTTITRMIFVTVLQVSRSLAQDCDGTRSIENHFIVCCAFNISVRVWLIVCCQKHGSASLGDRVEAVRGIPARVSLRYANL
jgi:hypothetical protein